MILNVIRDAWRAARLIDTLAFAVLLAIAVAALLAPAYGALVGVHHDTPDLTLRYAKAAWPHVLGCDAIGQDVLLRLLFGARVSLGLGIVAACAQTLVGGSVGVLAGVRGGIIDAVLMRSADLLLSLPLLPLLLVAAALKPAGVAQPGGGVVVLLVLLVVFGWMSVARVVRAEVLRTRTLQHTLAARAIGASPLRIVRHHVLPMLLPVVAVATTVDIARNILTEAALSYLGLGIRPPAPSWGNMLSHAESELVARPALAFFPGLAIVVTVACVTVLGEGLRRARDPRATA